MKFVLIILTLFSCLDGWSQSVYEISYSRDGHEPHLVKLSSGEVKFIGADDKDGLIAYQEKYLLAAPDEDEVKVKYEPTILPSYKTAQELLNKFRKDDVKDSQCYDRAHVWSYEAFKKFKVKSLKTFVFFTDQYIRKYEHKWWFHVAPSVMLKMNGAITHRIMDREFAKSPLQLKTWTDIFIKSKRACPLIEKFSDYTSNQDQEDCFHINTTMYLWQPSDVQYLRQANTQKTDFWDWQVKHSFQNGFGVQKTEQFILP